MVSICSQTHIPVRKLAPRASQEHRDRRCRARTASTTRGRGRESARNGLSPERLHRRDEIRNEMSERSERNDGNGGLDLRFVS